jgi:hypothetical protein
MHINRFEMSDLLLEFLNLLEAYINKNKISGDFLTNFNDLGITQELGSPNPIVSAVSLARQGKGEKGIEYKNLLDRLGITFVGCRGI